jgi:prepilin-type N-terminal cleavage/methylation domain-containing protein
MSLKRPSGRADDLSMRSGAPTLSDERGYTLVELLVAAFVLVVGMAGAFTLLNGANQASVVNNARMGSTNLAREMLEDARSVDYDSLTPSEIAGALQARMGVTGAPSPWTLSRRGIQYTVTVNVCTFDDPKDNIAATAPANVCTPQAPVVAGTGTDPDINGDDFRRVTVTLGWNTGRGNQTMSMVSLVNNPSGGLGPRITAFPTFALQVTTGTTATVNAVTTTAASLRWNSDGTPNGSGDATGGPLNWQAVWQLGPKAIGLPTSTANWQNLQYTAGSTVLDGTYTLTGQAFDDRGIAGDSRASVLPLNRSTPITVMGFEAGRNFNIGKLEFRWNQNPELDIIGYKVFDLGPDDQIGNGNDTLMCETASVDATSCVASTSMPSGNPTFGVVAYDRETIGDSTSNPRRSDYAEPVTITSTQPSEPTGLGYPPLSTVPALSWGHPDVGAVRFFRIYRATGTSGSCCSVAQRYDLTTGNITSWTDPNPPAFGVTVRYWVTAVGPGLNESTPSNDVTWVGQ